MINRNDSYRKQAVRYIIQALIILSCVMGIMSSGYAAPTTANNSAVAFGATKAAFIKNLNGAIRSISSSAGSSNSSQVQRFLNRNNLVTSFGVAHYSKESTGSIAKYVIANTINKITYCLKNTAAIENLKTRIGADQANIVIAKLQALRAYLAQVLQALVDVGAASKKDTAVASALSSVGSAVATASSSSAISSAASAQASALVG